MYRDAHTGWDCTDDSSNMTIPSFLPWMWSLMADLFIWKRKKEAYSSMNHEFKTLSLSFLGNPVCTKGTELQFLISLQPDGLHLWYFDPQL